jgi:catechol 2,3-dioxygenase-like lactoylglutathione lyase family enzyme
MLAPQVLLGIQHVALVVADLDRSRRFYGEQLGMEELERPASFSFAGAWYRAGGQEIHLIAAGDTTSEPGWKDPGPGARAGLAVHLAIEVDDLAAEQARLATNGIAVFTGPLQRGDGVVQLYVEDPDGHLVELFARTGEDQSNAAPRLPVRNAP